MGPKYADKTGWASRVLGISRAELVPAKIRPLAMNGAGFRPADGSFMAENRATSKPPQAVRTTARLRQEREERENRIGQDSPAKIVALAQIRALRTRNNE